MYCKYCETLIVDNTVICPYCGKNLNGEEVSAEVTPNIEQIVTRKILWGIALISAIVVFLGLFMPIIDLDFLGRADIFEVIDEFEYGGLTWTVICAIISIVLLLIGFKFDMVGFFPALTSLIGASVIGIVLREDMDYVGFGFYVILIFSLISAVCALICHIMYKS